VVLAFDDVTAMKEVEARLQEAVRVREDFVSIAGHEMKTPLTALQLTIESLTRLCHPPATESTLPATGVAPRPLASQPPPIDPQIVVKADSVQRQVRRLIRLVDQLLDVSRIAAGRFKLAVETFDLAALTAAIIARATEERGPGQSTIELICDGPVVGTWDRLRVDQVITNLISNAVKYGERTAIQIRVGRTEAGVQVAVSDGGIGIEVAQQERIFDRFERAVSDRNVAGLGLGLWIVRQILEAMNGRIRVESQPGRGATFTVDLPAGRARPT
jgi:signal transduction histidine kinase